MEVSPSNVLEGYLDTTKHIGTSTITLLLAVNVGGAIIASSGDSGPELIATAFIGGSVCAALTLISGHVSMLSASREVDRAFREPGYRPTFKTCRRFQYLQLGFFVTMIAVMLVAMGIGWAG